MVPMFTTYRHRRWSLDPDLPSTHGTIYSRSENTVCAAAWSILRINKRRKNKILKFNLIKNFCFNARFFWLTPDFFNSHFMMITPLYFGGNVSLCSPTINFRSDSILSMRFFVGVIRTRQSLTPKSRHLCEIRNTLEMKIDEVRWTTCWPSRIR